MRTSPPVVSACAKVLLCGEHFVLFGAPAVAVPLPRCRLTLFRRPRDVPCPPSVAAAWGLARAAFGLPPAAGFPFEVVSDIPIGAGLGSSAALSVALVRAAATEAGEAPGPGRVGDAARAVEDVFHGRSSGLDPAVVAHEVPVLRSGEGRDEAVAWGARGLDVVVAVTPGRRSTAQAVARVASFAAGDPGRFAAMLRDACGVAAEVAAVVRGTGGLSGRPLSRNQALLAELGLSSPAIESLIDVMMGAGAEDAKLSGAGIAGAVVALVSIDRVDAVLRAARAAGAVAAFPAGLVRP